MRIDWRIGSRENSTENIVSSLVDQGYESGGVQDSAEIEFIKVLVL